MKIQVVKLRGSCHLQDAGREGQAEAGMPRGGFADVKSAALANLLVGKKSSAILLECTLAAPDLFFEDPCNIAFTGADVQPKVNGVGIPMWQRIHVPQGAKISCSNTRNGLRTYISFSHQVIASTWRGSVSPVLLGKELFPSASVLTEGDQITLSGESSPVSSRISKAYVHVPDHLRLLRNEGEVILSVYPAPESSLLLENRTLFRAFQRALWDISPQSNRMGVRLLGPSLPLDNTGGKMRSGPVLPGTIQLLPDGNLIVTHVDSQTIGGYPRVGVLDAFGLAVLAQAVPGGGGVRFEMKD